MGVNDELTPREHDELRSRVLMGARRIKPVGAHRMQLIAASLALVLVAGVAGGAWATASLLGSGPVPAVTSPSPTPTSTPTPTAEPTPTPTQDPDPTALVPFDGDCSQLLDAEQVREIVGADVAPRVPSVFSIYGDGPAYARVLGALHCSWIADDWQSGIEITVYPSVSVPESVRDTYVEAECHISGFCEVGRTVGDFWVGVGIQLSGERRWTEEGRAQAQATALNVIGGLETALQTTTGRRAAPDPDWWRLEGCERFTSAVDSHVPGTLVDTIPIDSVPEGPLFEVAVAAGVVRYCPWSGGDDPALLEVFAQSGIGIPSPGQIDDRAVMTEIPGADAAWYLLSDNGAKDVLVVAVVGDNRLLVRYGVSEQAQHRLDAALAITRDLLAELG
jgi:hypothetical protein